MAWVDGEPLFAVLHGTPGRIRILDGPPLVPIEINPLPGLTSGATGMDLVQSGNLVGLGWSTRTNVFFSRIDGDEIIEQRGRARPMRR
ncbi:MAG: hypothetical protein R3F43_11390 [bacterium]